MLCDRLRKEHAYPHPHPHPGTSYARSVAHEEEELGSRHRVRSPRLTLVAAAVLGAEVLDGEVVVFPTSRQGEPRVLQGHQVVLTQHLFLLAAILERLLLPTHRLRR